MPTHFRSTFSGVTTTSDDGQSGHLVSLGTTVGDDWEVNVVERSSTSTSAAYAGGANAITNISSSEALIIANKTARCLKSFLGTSYDSAKVQKIVITLEMKG